MNCEEVALKIPDLVAGRLPADERIPVEAAILRCPHCIELRRQIEAFYALDLDSALKPRPVPMPDLPRENRFLSRRAAAAAAAIVLLFLSVWVFQRSDNKEVMVGKLEPLAVVLPELPMDAGDGLWTIGEAKAKMLSAYSGKPLATTYLFPFCPRCESMLDDLDRVEVHDILGDFVHQKVVFNEDLPEALRVRQHEVQNTMYIHTPALIITDAGVDEEALYDIDNLDMIEARVTRFKNEHSSSRKKSLDADRFESYRQIILRLPELLAAGKWGEALKSLRLGLADRDQYRSQFFVDFDALEGAILNQIEARIERAAADIESEGETATKARGRLQAMQEALDGEGPCERIHDLLAD